MFLMGYSLQGDSFLEGGGLQNYRYTIFIYKVIKM